MRERPFGVIEGFYGDPWTWDERAECIDAISRWGANTYVWAPKSEPRHRDGWSDPFTSEELGGFAMLASRAASVRVSVGLTPGDDATVGQVVAKLAPVLATGCGSVTLGFDDLPVLAAADRHRDLANGVRESTGADVWVVPTHYAGTTRSDYLDRLFRGLHEDILVMWTGEHVVNDVISAEDLRLRTDASDGRVPLVWDNVPVNDAMMAGHLHMGPFTGRAAGVARESAGFLLNPMISMKASLPTLRSACAWWHGEDHLAAWQEEAESLGLLLLAQATAYEGEPHWPGDSPAAEWFESVAAMPDTGDDDLDPWLESARHGARICLDALAVIDAAGRGVPARELARPARGLVKLRDWLRLPARTLGAGPRTRPFFTQDTTGRFAPAPGLVELTRSLPEVLVEKAVSALAGAPT